MLVENLADDLLQQVFHRHDARRAAVLVEHHGHVRLEALEVGQHFLHLARARHHVHRAHHVPHGEPARRIAQHRDEVLGQHQADDVVDRLFVHRVARPLRLDHEGHRLLQRAVDVERIDGRPRGHHLAGILLGELEHALDERGVLALQHAHLLALLHQDAQLVCRVYVLLRAAGLETEWHQHHFCRSVEHPRERLREPGKGDEAGHEPSCHALRVVDRRAARGQLPEHHVEVGDDRERAHRAKTGRANLHR